MACPVFFRFRLREVRCACVALLAGIVLCGSAQATEIGCTELAADKFGLDVSLINAILEVEGGHEGQAVSNTNGTEDLGPMQINTIWLPILAQHGITRRQLQHDRCINILVGSWILARQLKTAKDMEGPAHRRIWWAIGSYHSKTPEHNVRYAVKVWQALRTKSSSEHIRLFNDLRTAFHAR
jgi:soluble lytic murein transglycosylase-like protein